jgi:queuine tRNA-ribosyltransferase
METIAAFGGLTTSPPGSTTSFTDSGGYQIFSWHRSGRLLKRALSSSLTSDGSRHLLTPERAVDIQVTIGSDIQMVLDVCTGPEETLQGATEALETTGNGPGVPPPTAHGG